MHTVKLWKKQRKSGILQAGGKHIIFFPLKDYMKSKQRLTFYFFLPTVSLRLQYSDCLVCLHIYLFLIPQLWICQLSHKIQIKLLILFPYLKFIIDVASVFNICKQPLIYVHIVHFNLWKGQSEKKPNYSRIHNYNLDHLNQLSPWLVTAPFIQMVCSSQSLNR